MGKAERLPSEGQALNLVASFAVDTPWGEIETDMQPFIELPPIERGKRFAAFLRNGCRLDVGDPKTIPTKPFDPANFLGEGWAVWKGSDDGDGLSGEEDVDPRGIALTEIDVLKLCFETNLKKGENSIKGEKKLRRQKEMSNMIRLGGNTFLGLWEDYQANKENSALEYLYGTQKITFLDFMGQIFRSPGGGRDALYLWRSGDGEWRWDCGWLGDGWGSGNPSACAQVDTQDSVVQS